MPIAHPRGPVAQLGARFHGMEDSAYNLQTSTLKTKDLEYPEPLRKCSGQERTNDVTAPNCSDNLASKSTHCGRRRHDLGPTAIAHLRNEPRLNWSQIARSLGTSARTVRRQFAQNPEHMAPPNPVRRGRPYADLNAEEVLRLRGSGMRWRAIGRKLGWQNRYSRRSRPPAVASFHRGPLCERMARGPARGFPHIA